MSTTRTLEITRTERAYATIVGHRFGVTDQFPARDTLPVTTPGEDPFKMTAQLSRARNAETLTDAQATAALSRLLGALCEAIDSADEADALDIEASTPVVVEQRDP